MFKLRTGKEGVTLIENVMGVLLLGILITGMLGVYYVSATSLSRGRHIAVVNRELRSYLAKEVAAGYDGGDDDSSYYATMPMSTNGSETKTVGDITMTITCDPWFPDNIHDSDGDILMFGDIWYKIAGFTISWIDKTPTGRQNVTLSVRSAVIICQHL